MRKSESQPYKSQTWAILANSWVCVTMWVSKRICPDEKRVVEWLHVLYILLLTTQIKFVVQCNGDQKMYIFVYIETN